MGILVTPDGSVTLPGLLLIIGVPLIAIGQYNTSNGAPSGYFSGKPTQFILGTVCVTVGLALAIMGLVAEGREEEREELKYEALSAEEILGDLRFLASQQAVEQTIKVEKARGAGNSESNEQDTTKSKRVYNPDKSIKCLNALALKYGKEQARRKRDAAQSEERGESLEGWPGLLRYRPHELEILCQEAAYIVLGLHSANNAAVSSALSLLALVAGDGEVRRRNIEEADRFGLNTPIDSMRDALARAKNCNDPPEEEERVSAELQRKGCLLLGALSNEDKDLATKVVDEDGLLAVLDAVEWYRFHEEVANWALWAVFVLCYDHKGNKGELIKLGGIQKICRVMKDIPTSLEVARHGIAVLFDMMREIPGSLHDVAQIRMIAMNAGMHEVVKRAMDEFSDSKEIMMMGQQMLVATGYQGEIPKIQLKM